MKLPESFASIARLPRRVVRRAYTELKIRKLQAINRESTTPVVSLGGPIVSLTSYGTRVETTYLAIESIASGSLLPSELILWLDEEERYRFLPGTLERLTKRGLAIRLCKNYGPHKKYYPYVHSQEKFELPLVTADDDVLYPEDWLLTLNAAFLRDPSVVHGYRARVISFQGDRMAPYAEWPLCGSAKPSWRHFLNGTSGVIYPPRLLMALKEAGSRFEELCPKADDVWLHVNALRAGFKVQQIRAGALHFPLIPESQRNALFFDNIASGNDMQILKTYTQTDLQALAQS
jgi:hypothetical protein